MRQTLLIYSEPPSARLYYLLDWLCLEQLHLDYRCTLDQVEWHQWTGPKIVYHQTFQPEAALLIRPSGLLSESGIRAIPLAVQRWKHSTVLFYNQPGAIVPFDLFSAIFYLISRYEEYLPFNPDSHGRFPANASVAAQYCFFQQPVVDEWIHQWAKILEQKFSIVLKRPAFQYQVSFDLDRAWRYLYQQPGRQLMSTLKDVLSGNVTGLRTRRAVISGKQKDPFDCFDALLEAEYTEPPMFFFLLAEPGKYDRNTDKNHPAMKALVQQITKGTQAFGIHPSYASNKHPEQLLQEIKLLESYTGTGVTKSRQHYLKVSLPQTYRQLIKVGIRQEYSMGYAAQNGFRAGTSRSFLWYDLTSETATELRVHPFAFMDATAWFYKKYSLEEAFAEWERLYLAVRKTQGCFMAIWHNHLLVDQMQPLFWQTQRYVRSQQ